MTSETRVQHTPGPWSAVHSSYGYGEDITIQAATRGGNPLYVGRVYNAGIRARSSPEAEANARLIAAAPDLLAALEALTSEVLSHDELDEDDDMRAMVNVALEAMRRARGED